MNHTTVFAVYAGSLFAAGSLAEPVSVAPKIDVNRVAAHVKVWPQMISGRIQSERVAL